MKINIDKFVQTYRVEIKKNKKKYDWKFMFHLCVFMFIYSMGIEKYGEKAIYHVFMIGIVSIFCACWGSHFKKDN